MSKDKVHYFDVGCWPIFFGFTASEKAFTKEMKRLKVKGVSAKFPCDKDAVTHVFCNENSAPTTTVIVTMHKKFLGKKYQVSGVAALIAHEATHVWQEIQRVMGEERPGDEVEAYAVQHFTQKMLEVIWEK